MLKKKTYRPDDYPPIKIPEEFLKIARGWPDTEENRKLGKGIKNFTINNLGLQISLAIIDYDKKLQRLSATQMKELNNSNIKKCWKWFHDGKLTAKPRGVPRLETAKSLR